MVRVGIVGIGFMGMIHHLAYGKAKGGKVAAICSRDPRRLAGDWTDIQGNFGPRGSVMDLSGIKKYSRVQDLLADPEIDLIDLCTPNDAHASLAIAALDAGKHVLVEKPIALAIDEAELMLAAAARSGKMLMTAHVLPFFPEFAFARRAVESHRYGKLLAAHFTRVISKPDWSAGIADLAKSGGPAIDLHIHDTHFIGLVCGTPSAVHSRGVIDEPSGAVLHLATQYLYDTPVPAVSAVSGALSQPGRPFAHGFEIWLEKATIAFEFATLGGAAHVATPLSVLLPDGSVEHPQLGSGEPVDAFADELGQALEGVRSGILPAALSGTLATQALRLCLAEIESVRSGRVVAVGG